MKNVIERFCRWYLKRKDILCFNELSHELTETADARGYLTGFPQFGRVADPYDEVEVFTHVRQNKPS